MQTGYSPHEMLELHELLSAETTVAQKLQSMLQDVEDKELKTFMQSSLKSKQNRVERMRQMVSAAVPANPNQQGVQ